MTKPVRVYCVYRTGVRSTKHSEYSYTREYVEKLRRGVERHLPEPYDFRCLTDVPTASYDVPLQHEWPGWWSKIELFRPDQVSTAPAIYLDLDTVICGPIGWAVRRAPGFAMQHYVDGKRPARWCSAYMAWQGDYTPLYRRFAADPDHWIRRHKTMAHGKGDQGFIAEGVSSMNEDILRIDEHASGAIGSQTSSEYDRDLCLAHFKGSYKQHMMPAHPLVRGHWV